MFDGALNLESSLAAMTRMISDLEVNKKAMKQAADLGYETVTDFTYWLVCELGVLFREAPHMAGCGVALAERKWCYFQDLSLDELQAIDLS